MSQLGSPPYTPRTPPYFSPRSPYRYSPRTPPYSPSRSPWASDVDSDGYLASREISSPSYVRSDASDDTIRPDTEKTRVDSDSSFLDAFLGMGIASSSTASSVPISPPAPSTSTTTVFSLGVPGIGEPTPPTTPPLFTDPGAALNAGFPGYHNPPNLKAEETDSSQFFCSNLSDTNPVRRVKASVARAQAAAMPDPPYRRRDRYPHRFANFERLELVNNLPPLVEHPLTPDEPWTPGTPPGPARILTNETDHSTPEVCYHDPTKPRDNGQRHHPLTMATYRPRFTGSTHGGG